MQSQLGKSNSMFYICTRLAEITTGKATFKKDDTTIKDTLRGGAVGSSLGS